MQIVANIGLRILRLLRLGAALRIFSLAEHEAEAHQRHDSWWYLGPILVVVWLGASAAYWSLEQVSVVDEPELLARRAAGLAIRAAAALALVAFALAALDLRTGGGLLLEAVGAAAAVALLALVLLLARAGHESPER